MKRSEGVRMMRRKANPLLTTAAVLAVFSAPSSVAAQRGDAEAVRALDEYVARAVQDWKVPGLALAVVKDGRVILSKGYGSRELGRADRVDGGTRFAIGSTTKAMTAVALGILVDEGKVDWDEPVITYLPAFRVADPYVTRELTVRDLLTHRGGLGNADQLWLSADYTIEEIVQRLGTLPAAYSLRSSFIYQNVMYAVAGQVIEAASGMAWQEFFTTRIFRPLGMNGTAPTLASLAGQPNVASPHMEIDGQIRPVKNRPVDVVGTAGSVWSSVDDMARWMRFILNGGELDGTRLLKERTHAEIMSPQVVAPQSMYPTMTVVRPRFFTYGLGWFLHDYAGEAVAMHTGSIDGMSALIGLLPDRSIGVYVLANLDHAELRHAVMYRVFDVFSGRPARDWSAELLALYEQRSNAAAAAQQRQRRAADTQPSLPLERYVGTYSDPTYGTAQVALQDGALRFSFGSGRVGTLSHWQYDTFQATWEDVRRGQSLIVFMADGTGGVSAVRAFGITFRRDAPPGR